MNMISLYALAEAASDAAASSAESGDNFFQDIVDHPGDISAIGRFFQNLGTSILNVLPTILFAIIVLIVGTIFTKLALKLISKGLSKTKLEVTVTKFTVQMAKIVLYVLLITIVLNILGIPSSSIIAVIGTAGVAIGLALQNSLSNVAGGFLLMITKPFKVGDYIVSNGVEGTVSQISILHTQLNSVSNQAIFIPNGLAINATIINNNGNDTRRVDLNFSISYNDDYEKARGIIMEIIQKHPLILKNPAPFVRMSEHGASAIVITSRSWCATSDYWDVYFDLTEQVRAAFIENHIEIPFDQIDVHMIQQ